MWFGVDPMAEKHPNYNPFAYTANNPVRFIDPDGRDWYEDECNPGKMQWFEGNGTQNGFINRGSNHQIGKNLYTTDNNNQPLSFDNALEPVEVSADRICKSESNSNSSLSDVWNSPIGRSVVPDKVGFSLSTSATVGAGTTSSLNIDWITRGNDASIIPYLTLTTGMQGGPKASADGTLSLTAGYFFSSDMRKEPSGSVANGLLGWGSYGSGSVGMGGNVSLSGSVGFSGKIGTTPTWFSGGVGFGAGVGGGFSGGFSQTMPLFNSQFKRK